MLPVTCKTKNHSANQSEKSLVTSKGFKEEAKDQAEKNVATALRALKMSFKSI